MDLFLTRRTYNSASHQFTDNTASLTRYVGMQASANGASRGHMMSSTDWARSVMGQSDDGRVLVYVHGFNNSQKSMLTRLRLIKAGLAKQGYRGAVIAFDWPSNGARKSYHADRKKAWLVSPFLVADGLNLIRKVKPDARFQIVAHSMGAYLTLQSLSKMGTPPAPFAFEGKVDHVALVAGDVNRDAMMAGAGGALVLQHRADAVTNYYSHEDKALHASGQSVNWFSIRVGQQGMHPSPPPGFADVSCTDRYFTAVPKQRDRTTVRSHDFYFHDSRFYSDLALALGGKPAASIQTRQPHAGGDQRILP